MAIMCRPVCVELMESVLDFSFLLPTYGVRVCIRCNDVFDAPDSQHSAHTSRFQMTSRRHYGLKLVPKMTNSNVLFFASS
jgi:hypothetical protein